MQNLLKTTSWAMILTYAVIVIGAAVRVYDAGLSCPDWPKCYGVWVPFPAEESWGYSNWQVFLEWFHRLLAGILGFLILAVAIMSFKNRKAHKGVFFWPLTALIILFVQVKLGMATVLLENIHWSVAIHLGNAMLLFSALIIARKKMAVALDSNNKLIPAPRAFKVNVWFAFVLTFITMLMGAMVSTSYSGGVCGGLPFCNGEVFPSAKENLQGMLHMKHRLYALLTFIATLALFFTARKADPAYKKTAKGINIIVFGQVIIGTVLLYSFSHYAWAYKGLSVFHLAWGTLIILASVGALAKMRYGVGGSFHK